MDVPLLKIEALSKSYGRKQILRDISLDIRSGEIIGIIGASGTGKTTFLNCLVGFIKADSGDVLFKEPGLLGTETVIYKSVYKQQRKFKRVYGFAAQVPSFYEKLTVKENVIYFGSLYDLSRDTLNTNVNTLLKLMNLSNASYILGKNLSGGMERRLDIACALVHNPQLLILDEPTADLDPILRNNIWDLLKQINKKGTTILLSSHHLNELETLCTSIVILKDGTIFDKGTPEELKEKYLKNQELVVETYPGNYEASGEYLRRCFKKHIHDYKVSEGRLVLTCTDPEKIISNIMSKLEKKGEKVIEIKIVKPSLDQLFISLNQKKDFKPKKLIKEEVENKKEITNSKFEQPQKNKDKSKNNEIQEAQKNKQTDKKTTKNNEEEYSNIEEEKDETNKNAN